MTIAGVSLPGVILGNLLSLSDPDVQPRVPQETPPFVKRKERPLWGGLSSLPFHVIPDRKAVVP